jgi:hypothetical protein
MLRGHHGAKHVAPLDGSRKRRRAALILRITPLASALIDLPVIAGRTAAHSLPFKENLPFDIDSAAVSYFAQPAKRRRSKWWR